MMRKTVLAVLAAVTLAVSLGSCSRVAGLSSIEFPSTPVISSVDSVVLVLDPYISIRDQPGDKGITVAHGRRGEIFAVTGKRIIQSDKDEAVWIRLEKGWVAESAVRLYSSREKAEQGALLLK